MKNYDYLDLKNDLVNLLWNDLWALMDAFVYLARFKSVAGVVLGSLSELISSLSKLIKDIKTNTGFIIGTLNYSLRIKK